MKCYDRKLLPRSSMKRATLSDWTKVNALKMTFRYKRSENSTSIDDAILALNLHNMLKFAQSILYFYIFTARNEGNIFTGVCDSVHKGGGSGLGGVPGVGGIWSPGGIWSRGVPGLECLVSGGGGDWSGVPGGDSPSEMATASGGTHPTGMHSCI